MGPFYLFLFVFLIAWLLVYGAMRLACYIKQKYCQAENVLCKVLETFECVSCRESCTNHLKLLIRSVLFALLLASVFVAAYCMR